MADINFPLPVSSPYTDPNGVIWEHDGDGWINKVALTGGGGSLPDGGLIDQVLSKNSNADQDFSWNFIKTDGGIF